MADIVEKIKTLVKEQKDESISFLQDMARIKSINPVFTTSKPVEERECQEFLAERLKTLGFTDIDLWEPDAEELRKKYLGKPGYTPNRKFVNRPNLVGRLPGSGGGRSLFLTGHVDVVGADAEKEAWKHDPFAGVIEDGKMYGRGVTDMKGGIAAMIEAVRYIQLAGLKLRGDVYVGTVIDEETGSMGMLSIVDRGYSADAGIMTEPTCNKLSLVCRGIIWGTLRIPGKSGHIEVYQASAKEGGSSDAIRFARRIMDEFDQMNFEWARRAAKKHPLLPRPNEINVSMIEGGQHPSAYAEECRITVDIQYIPGERDENGLGGDIKREIEERVRHLSEKDPYLSDHPVEFDWFVDADCGEVPVDHELVSICRRHLDTVGVDSTPGGSEFHTDMSLLTNNGTPTINIGPGDPMLAHQTNEFIELDEYVDSISILAAVILDWCGYEEE